MELPSGGPSPGQEAEVVEVIMVLLAQYHLVVVMVEVVLFMFLFHKLVLYKVL